MKPMLQHLTMASAVLIAVLLIAFPAHVLGAEPKAGDVINSSNVEQYTEYLPSFLARFVKDGWGFEAPVVIYVKESEKWPITKRYAEASKNNAGKVKLTSDGLLEGYNGIGLPFPDPQEPDRALKIMWNQYYRDLPDDWSLPITLKSFGRRKGGPVTSSDSIYNALKFSGRTYVPPVPDHPNPNNLRYARLSVSLKPPAKDMAVLIWRYNDPTKNDDMWSYVPSLRRTIRMVSSERSNPIQGSVLTWDEIFCFDGIVTQFTYKFLGERTVLNLANQKMTADTIPGDGMYRHPIIFGPDEPFELVDTYLMEIKSKNPRYPTSLWHLWVHNEHFVGCFAEMYNKRGDFWKAYNHTFQKRPLNHTDGEIFPISLASGITDFITETWGLTFNGKLDMNTGLDVYQFDPASLGSAGFSR